MMKPALALSLTVALGALGSIGVPVNAYAVNANHSGTICKNYNAGQVMDIDYLTSGTRNLNVNSRYIICPIVRSPTSNNRLAVYVDGIHYGTRTTTCTLYSYDYTGAFQGSQSFTFTGSGNFDRYLSVPSTYWAAGSVLCNIPGSATGVLRDIDVVQ
jgi:hypothetical protein